jgi:hypothetical protein
VKRRIDIIFANAGVAATMRRTVLGQSLSGHSSLGDTR